MREAEQAVCWVIDNYIDCVKFDVYTDTIKSIAVYLEYNKADSYSSMTMMYGVLFTLALIEYYTSIEYYEKCHQLQQGILRINDLYGANLPTSMRDKWVLENMHLTPSEILNKHYKNK